MQKKYFSKYKESSVALPNLVEVQLNSFDWFLKTGLKEIFTEFFPVLDYTEKEFVLEFLDFSVGDPKYGEHHSRMNNLTYEAPIKIRVKLTTKEFKYAKEQ